MSSRGFLFDLNGVFYEDNKVLDGAIEIINLLREKKIPFRFISNNTTLSRRFFIKKLNEIGLNILNEEIFTANYAGYLIAKKLKLKNCRLIYYLILSDSIKKLEFGKDSFILGKVSAPELAKFKKKLVDEALKYLS